MDDTHANIERPVEETEGQDRDQSLATANTIICFLISILLVATCSFIVGGALNRYWFVVGLGLAAIHGWWNVTRYFSARHAFHCARVWGALMVVVLLSMLLSGMFREYSSDGQTYHASARLELARGLNPFYETSLDERIRDFPLASSIWGTVIYELTGRIDSSRAVNFILIVACFLYAHSTFSVIAPQMKTLNALFAGLLTFNPIVITESLSFMNDGQMASLTAILICQALLLRRRREWPLLVAFGGCLIMASNLKLTGFFYAAILGGGLIAWFLVCDRVVPFLASRKGQVDSRGSFLGDLLRSFDGYEKWRLSVLVGSLVVAVGFFGYSSYVRTFVRSGSLLDVVGNDLEAYLRSHPGNIPTNWIQLKPSERLLASIFSISQLSGDVDARLKTPFTVTADEVETFYTGDNRVGGLGPLFGGAILISLVLLLAGLVRAWRRDRATIDMLFLTFLIAGSVVVNPLAWQVRYAPQLWSIPVLIGWFSLRPEGARRFVRMAVFCLSVTILTNVILIAASYFRQQVQATRQINMHLASMRLSGVSHVSARNRGVFRAYLDEEGISYKEVGLSEMKPGNVVEVPYFDGEVFYSRRSD